MKLISYCWPNPFQLGGDGLLLSPWFVWFDPWQCVTEWRLKTPHNHTCHSIGAWSATVAVHEAWAQILRPQFPWWKYMGWWQALALDRIYESITSWMHNHLSIVSALMDGCHHFAGITRYVDEIVIGASAEREHKSVVWISPLIDLILGLWFR